MMAAKEPNKYPFPSKGTPGYAPFSLAKNQPSTSTNPNGYGSTGSVNSNNSNSSMKYNIIPKKKRMSASFSKYAFKPLPKPNIAKPGVDAIKEVANPPAPTTRPVQSTFINEHKELISIDFTHPSNATKPELQQLREKVNNLYDEDVVSLETFYDEQLRILDEMLADM
eukprot:221695_1